MDGIEALVTDSQICAAVLGRGETFLLVPLVGDGTPMDKTLLAEAHAKQLEFCGVFGVVNGLARCQSATPSDLPTMCAAIPAFLEYVAGTLVPPVGDSVDWLHKLYALPDERIEFGPDS